MKNKKKKDENLMSRSLAAVSCDDYGSVHSFLNGVFSVLRTQKLRKELKLPPEVPPGPRPIVRTESGPISAVVFFFFFRPLTSGEQFVCFQGTAHPQQRLGGVQALPAAPRLTALVGPAGLLPPRQGNLNLTLEGTGSSSGSRHQGGAGGKRPVPWKAGSWQPSAANCTHLRESGEP